MTSHPVVAVLLAVCSALCYATAACLQRRETAAVVAEIAEPGVHRSFLPLLVRRGRWWVGVGVMGLGAAIHVVALGAGSINLVQPIGTLALVLALPLDARLSRRRIARGEWIGAGALVVGLTGLLTVAPHHASTATPPPPVLLATLATAVLVAALLAGAGAGRRWTVQPVLRAAAAGVCLGTTSAMVRIALRSFPVDHVVGVIAGLAALTLPIVGLLLQQTAYRDGGLDGPLATLTLTDPAVASAIGLLALGERFSGGPLGAGVAVLSAAVAALALVGLIRASPPEPAFVTRAG